MEVEKALEKLRKKHGEANRLVRILYDVEHYFLESLLWEVTELYEMGYSPEEIGKAVNRDPDEVFLALFHQARHDKLTRAFGKRCRDVG